MMKDTKAKDRVYVVYWSGGDEYSHDGGCKNHIKLHYLRVENGNLASKGKPGQ